MSEVNQKQIGGEHYRSPIQHWDFVEANNLGYLEGCATKYATRNRKKHQNPKEDLEKARHYVEKLLDLFETKGRVNRRRYYNGADQFKMAPLVITVEEFAEANRLTPNETAFVQCLTEWRNAEQLKTALRLIDRLLEEV